MPDNEKSSIQGGGQKDLDALLNGGSSQGGQEELDALLNSDVKKKETESPKPLGKSVSSSAPSQIFSNLKSSSPTHTDKDIKDAQSSFTELQDSLRKDAMSGNPIDGHIIDEEDKKILESQAIKDKIKADFTLNPDRFLDGGERGRYYKALNLSPKERDDVIKYGEEVSGVLQSYNVARVNAYQDPSPFNMSLLSDIQTDNGDHHTANVTNSYIQKQHPDSVEGWVGASYMLASVNQYPAAIMALSKAENIDPNSVWVSAHKAQFQLHAGDKVGAIQTINDAINKIGEINSDEDLRNGVYAYKTRASIRQNLGTPGYADDLSKADAMVRSYHEGSNYGAEKKLDDIEAGAAQGNNDNPTVDVGAGEEMSSLNPPTAKGEQEPKDLQTNPQYQGMAGLVKHPDLYLMRTYHNLVDNIKEAGGSFGNMGYMVSPEELKSKGLEDNAIGRLEYGFGNAANGVTKSVASIFGVIGAPLQPLFESFGKNLPDVAKWISPVTAATQPKTWLGQQAAGLFDTFFQVALAEGVKEGANKFTPEALAKNKYDSEIESIKSEAIASKPADFKPLTDEEADEIYQEKHKDDKIKTPKFSTKDLDVKISGNEIQESVKETLKAQRSGVTPSAEKLANIAFTVQNGRDLTSRQMTGGVEAVKGVGDIVKSNPEVVKETIQKSTVSKKGYIDQSAVDEVNKAYKEKYGSKEQQAVENTAEEPKKKLTDILGEGVVTENKGGKDLFYKDNVLITNTDKIKVLQKKLDSFNEEKSKEVEPIKITSNITSPSKTDLTPIQINDNFNIEELNNARKAGAKIQDGIRYDMQKHNPDAVYGGKFSVEMPSGKKISGSYVFHKPSDVIPSHINGEPNPASFYPDAAPLSRLAAIGTEQESSILNPSNVGYSETIHDGAPIINKGRYVAQGNGRQNLINKYDFINDPSDYYSHLSEHKKELGITDAQINSAKKNGHALYREVNMNDAGFIKLGQMSEDNMEEPTKERIDAESFTAKMSNQPSYVFEKIQNAINNGDNMSFLGALVQHSLKNPLEAGSMINGGEIGYAGNKALSEIVDGQIASGGDNKLYDDVKKLPNSIKYNLKNSIFTIHAMGEASFLPELQSAISYYSDWLHNNPKNLSFDIYSHTANESGLKYADVMNTHEMEFAHLLHDSYAHPNTLSVVANDIFTSLKENPSYTKTKALNEYFGLNEDEPEILTKNNKFKESLYGKDGIQSGKPGGFGGNEPTGEVIKDQEEGQNGNPPGNTPPPPQGNAEGTPPTGGSGKTFGTPKGVVDVLWSQHLKLPSNFFNNWNFGIEPKKPISGDDFTSDKFIPESEEPPPIFTERGDIFSAAGNVDQWRKGVRGAPLGEGNYITGNLSDVDKLRNITKANFGYSGMVKTAFNSIESKMLDLYPELNIPSVKQSVDEHIDAGGSANNMPSTFSEAQQAYTHLIDKVRADGSANMAKKLLEWDSKRGGGFSLKYNQIINDAITYNKKIPIGFVKDELARAMNEDKGIGNKETAKNVFGRKQSVKNPDDIFHQEKYVKATNDNGDVKIVHFLDNGDVQHFNEKTTPKVGENATILPFLDEEDMSNINKENTKNRFEAETFAKWDGGTIPETINDGSVDWRISRATKKEIENGSNERYLKEPLYAAMQTFQAMSDLLGQARMHDIIMKDPGFSDKIITLTPAQLDFENKVIERNKPDYDAKLRDSKSSLDKEYIDNKLPKDAFSPDPRKLNIKNNTLVKTLDALHKESYVKMDGMSPVWDDVRWKQNIKDIYQNSILSRPTDLSTTTSAFLSVYLIPRLFGLGHSYNVLSDAVTNFTGQSLFDRHVIKNVGSDMSGVSMAIKSLRDKDNLQKLATVSGHKWINTNDGYSDMLSNIAKNVATDDEGYYDFLKATGNTDGGKIESIKKNGGDAIKYVGKKFNDFENKSIWYAQNISNYAQLLSRAKKMGVDLDNVDYEDPKTQETFRQAVIENNRHIVTYDINPYLLTTKKVLGVDIGKKVADVMRNKNALVFAAYNTSLLRVLGNDIKDITDRFIPKNLSPEEQSYRNNLFKEATGRMATRATLIYTHFWLQNQLNKPRTREDFESDDDYEAYLKNPDSYNNIRFTGTLKPTYGFFKGLKDNGILGGVKSILDNFTASPVIQTASAVTTGWDNGKQLYDPSDSWIGKKGMAVLNYLMGGDNTVKVMDGAIHGDWKEAKEGIKSMFLPDNYTKLSKPESEVVSSLHYYSNYGGARDQINQAKKVMDDFRASPDGTNEKKYTPMIMDWYKSIYESKGKLLDAAKKSTDELLSDIAQGGSTPTMDKKSPDMIYDYLSSHPEDSNLGEKEVLKRARIEFWTNYEKQLDEDIKTYKENTPESMLDFIRSTVRGIHNEDDLEAQNDELWNDASNDDEFIKQTVKDMQNNFEGKK